MLNYGCPYQKIHSQMFKTKNFPTFHYSSVHPRDICHTCIYSKYAPHTSCRTYKDFAADESESDIEDEMTGRGNPWYWPMFYMLLACVALLVAGMAVLMGIFVGVVLMRVGEWVLLKGVVDGARVWAEEWAVEMRDMLKEFGK